MKARPTAAQLLEGLASVGMPMYYGRILLRPVGSLGGSDPAANHRDSTPIVAFVIAHAESI